MNHQVTSQKAKTILTLLFILLAVCLLSGVPAQAAGVSMSDVTTSSGGKFVKRDGKWMYRQKDGSYAKDCLLKINGKTYCFSKNGYRQSGWKKLEGDYYYFGKQSEGYLYRLRWLKLGKQTYFLKKSGKRATGWLTWQGKKYYFNQKGQRLSGWQTIQKKKYYLGTASQGYLYRNRLFTYKKYTFYLQNNGAVATGWKTVSGNRYYFLANGRAATGKRTINGETCYFNAKGILQHTGANLNIASRCAILIDANTGKVLYSKNATEKHANASTTKIMTCILALENASLNDRVSVSAYAASQEPSKLYMTAGDSFTLNDLLYSLMLPSHNDTAVAIAEHVSGSTSAFAKKMNEKAKQLGCTSTHFVTPNGLDAGLNHYTTARDLAKIAQYAWKNATFRKIVGTSAWRFSSRQGHSYSVATTNALLRTMKGVTGMKTGFTNKAGYCFVGVVKAKSGKQYISVTLGAGSSTARWQDARTLLAYAYKH
ncbi:MAG: serine hydrolase [Lachnospiraceae bacterium]